jgi:hypothetical protein
VLRQDGRRALRQSGPRGRSARGRTNASPSSGFMKPRGRACGSGTLGRPRSPAAAMDHEGMGDAMGPEEPFRLGVVELEADPETVRVVRELDVPVGFPAVRAPDESPDERRSRRVLAHRLGSGPRERRAALARRPLRWPPLARPLALPYRCHWTSRSIASTATRDPNPRVRPRVRWRDRPSPAPRSGGRASESHETAA